MSYCDIQQNCLWIKQLIDAVEVKNQTILEQAGVILRNAKQIKELESKLDITSRQYNALQKKYVELLQSFKKAEQEYNNQSKNLEMLIDYMNKSNEKPIKHAGEVVFISHRKRS